MQNSLSNQSQCLWNKGEISRLERISRAYCILDSSNFRQAPLGVQIRSGMQARKIINTVKIVSNRFV